MGHLNLRAIDSAYKMPEKTKTEKETGPVNDDFRKLLEEKQESEPKAEAKDTDSPKQGEEPVEEKSTVSTGENGVYAIYQLNPVQGIQTLETETVQGQENPDGGVILEGAVEILPEGEQMPEMAGNITYPQGEAVDVKEGQPEGNTVFGEQLKAETQTVSETTANPEEPLAPQVREKPETSLSAEVREKPETSLTSEVIADRKEPLASEVIAEQKTQAASEIQEAEPEVQAVPEGESHPSGQLSVEAEKQETALNGEGTQQGENLSPVQTLASQNTQADRAEFAAQEESVTTMTVRQPEEIPQKLTEQLLVKTARGVNEFEIHIEPVNLGKIAIKILYEQGQTTISILCSEKKTMELVGQNARDIGNVMEQNLGGTTTIILDKQDTDYLNQERNDNGQAEREAQQEKQKEEGRKHKAEDAEQFLQKLRLGLAI